MPNIKELLTSQLIGWSGRSKLRSQADGRINLENNAASGFSRLTLGLENNVHPALARVGSSSILRCVVGDESFSAQLQHDLRPIATPASQPINFNHSGALLHNTGAAAEVNLTLTGAFPGLWFMFFVAVAQNFRITAAAGDTIRVGSSVSGEAGNVVANTVGNALTLMALDTAQWIAIAREGTWTVT